MITLMMKWYGCVSNKVYPHGMYVASSFPNLKTQDDIPQAKVSSINHTGVAAE